MITFAKKQDLNYLIDIWNVCFNEDETFTNWFFNKIYKEKNTLIYKKNNKIISMLQMIKMNFNKYPITYIYGACTLPDYRKYGYMKKLLLTSFNIDRINNIKASILIPQSLKLFDYYEQFGYKKHFLMSKNYIKYDLYNMQKLYNNNKYCINRNFYYMKNQLELFKHTDDDVYCLYNNKNILSYAFLTKKNNSFIIQELIGNEIICNYIMQKFYLKKILVYSPIINNTKNQIINGSLKIYNENQDKEIKKCNYLNLVFN